PRGQRQRRLSAVERRESFLQPLSRRVALADVNEAPRDLARGPVLERRRQVDRRRDGSRRRILFGRGVYREGFESHGISPFFGRTLSQAGALRHGIRGAAEVVLTVKPSGGRRNQSRSGEVSP